MASRPPPKDPPKDARDPRPKPVPKPAPQPVRNGDIDDSTILAPAPDFSFSEFAVPAPASTGVFEEEEEEDTTGVPLKVGRRMLVPPSSSDVSVIEAREDSMMAKGASIFDRPGVELEDDNVQPATEVIRLMRSDADQGPELSQVTPPVMRKWKIGGDDDDPDLPTGPGGPRPGAAPHAGFNLPVTDHVAEDHRRRAGTRVDAATEGAAVGGKPAIDVDELRKNLSEVEKLVRQVKTQAAGLDLEAARGMNAQLAAALHRLAEALAMLR
jgi:hypothetical protein